MKRFRTILRERKGETLVEVICAAVIFLIALMALHGGVRFAHSAFQKAGQLRADAVELQRSLREEEASPVLDTEEYTFYADDSVSSAFRVTVGLGEKEAVYASSDGEEIVTFSLFLPVQAKEGGE